MPSRNVTKIDVADSYYHVYARGHSRQAIFLDEQDYSFFLSLFKRYLSSKPQTDSNGVPYPHWHNKAVLLCFCLMRNHFHLLIYQRQAGSMSGLMRGVMTSYSRYYNKKHHHSGSVFESRYKASLIYDQSYLEHISRYIHLNRKDWAATPYSSSSYFIGDNKADWLDPAPILAMFNSREEYKQFVADYEANQRMIDELKYELANDITP